MKSRIYPDLQSQHKQLDPETMPLRGNILAGVEEAPEPFMHHLIEDSYLPQGITKVDVHPHIFPETASGNYVASDPIIS